MDRSEVFTMLAVELERWRCLPFDELVGLVGLPPIVTSVSMGSEVVEIEFSIVWADTKRSRLRVDAIANGPSCFRLERLEESMTLRAPESTEADIA